MEWEEELLPAELLRLGYKSAGREYAWRKEDVLVVIDYLTKHHVRVLGVEVWVPMEKGPGIPGYYGDEAASEFPGPIEEHNEITKRYIRDFKWDEGEPARNTTPYFNLTVDAELE